MVKENYKQSEKKQSIEAKSANTWSSKTTLNVFVHAF